MNAAIPTERFSKVANGATVHLARKGKGRKRRFNFVVLGEEGIVTGVKDKSLKEVRDFAYEYGWEGFFL